LDLIRKASRIVPVVVVEMGDDFSPGLLAAEIPLNSCAVFLIETEIADSFIIWNETLGAFLSVVGDHHFLVRIRLTQKAMDRQGQESAPVVRRTNHRHERGGRALPLERPPSFHNAECREIPS